MNSSEVRQRFLNFFAERDHKVLPSSSLIPFNDPTILLTTAGMVQFKPYFLGQAKPPYPRVATAQKSFRTADIEVVGHDGHHLTFFEMLGNFSFGDYFKEKAIPYAYALLTEGFHLEKERLWAGIHNEDDEAYEIWIKETDIPAERVRRFGDEYNFWAAGPTGPCGPDSEIHYDWGEQYGCGRSDCGPNCEHCDRFLEVWNLVFMQWDRDESGRRTPLQRKGIDTGMGLERITGVVNRQRSVFDTDLFRPLLEHWAQQAGRGYGNHAETDVSLRALADHSRGSTMLLADGVVPSNEGRGYVLRRLIRRGMVHARRIGAGEGLSSAVAVVARTLGRTYPEVESKRREIAGTLRAEEERFVVALRQGMERLTGLLDRGELRPEDVFYLHDTLGFPMELSLELAAERGVTVERRSVEALMDQQRTKSRGAAGQFTAQLGKTPSRFVGYDRLETETTVTEIFPVAGEPDLADVFLPQTPFYAERGGQAADHGWLEWAGSKAEVVDVQAQGEAIRHRVHAPADRLRVGQQVRARVDPVRRLALAQHHSATHLLHRAIRQVLGEEAGQAGSAVFPGYATFDFRFPRVLSAGELDQVRRLLNQKIRENLPRRVEMLPLADAVASGAIALFDEKYGDTVRVVSFGDWSSELCGGTHVERTGGIGMALLSGDRSIGAGVRRIEMRVAAAAEDQVRQYEEVLARLEDAVKGAPAELPGKVEALQAEVKSLEKEIGQLKSRLAAGGATPIEEASVDGVTLLLQQVDPGEKDLLLFADQALGRADGRALAVIVAGRMFAVKVGPAVADRLSASEVVKAFVKAAGGKGGGRGPVGQGGGIDPARVREGFRSVQEYVRTRSGGR